MRQYRDPWYKGNSIGEYQFWVDGAWNSSTCQGGRCARLDCHETNSHFQLLGVYKETDGLVDWGEQLFKHQGYCVWDGDKGESGDSGDGGNDDEDGSYDFMQERLQSWPTECTKMYLTDYDGNAVYLDSMPLPGGNITYGMYTDEDCTQQSSFTFSQYVIKYYTSYYYSSEKGEQAAAGWMSNFQRWNELLTEFKYCQPCRAYNRIPTYDGDSHDNGDENNNNNNDQGNGEDGEGGAEQFGYNCYDDAGYQNCNQCYKFFTKTDLEVADATDLARASKQGTILAINYEGTVYGKGSFRSPPETSVMIFWGVLCVSVTLLICLVGRRPLYRILFDHWTAWRRNRNIAKELEETFDVMTACSASVMTSSTSEEEKQLREQTKAQQDLIDAKQDEIDQLKIELDMERVMRQLQKSRAQEQVHALQEEIGKFQVDPTTRDSILSKEQTGFVDTSQYSDAEFLESYSEYIEID